MKNVKLTIFKTLIILLSFIGIERYLQFNHSKDPNNNEKLLFKESMRVLSSCFDLENKNERSPKKSIELIEYCLNEYGYKK